MIQGRIVTTLPSATEMVVALGAQDRLVGVSNYCDPGIEGLTRVGTALSPNIEAIVGLSPDIVLLPEGPGAEKLFTLLQHFSLKTLRVKIDRLEDIYSALLSLGEVLALGERAHRLVGKVKTSLAGAKEKKALSGQRVMVVVEAQRGAGGHYRQITLASRESFYGDILSTIGLEVISPGGRAFVPVTLEQFSSFRVQGLIAIGGLWMSEGEDGGIWPNGHIQWVRPLSGPKYTIPGPRIVEDILGALGVE